MVDEDAVEARTGIRRGWSGYNKIAGFAGPHRSLIGKIITGERSLTPATKQAIVDGLSAELNRLKSCGAIQESDQAMSDDRPKLLDSDGWRNVSE